MCRNRTAIICFCLALLLSAKSFPAAGHEVNAPDLKAEGIAYTTDIVGTPAELNKDDLLALTEAIAQADRPPPSVYLLKRRLEKDAATLKKALQAAGYYDAAVTETILGDAPAKALFSITPGTRYQLVNIRMLPDAETVTQDAQLPPPRKLGFKMPQPLSYQDVLNGAEKLQAQVFDANCLRSVTIRPLLRVDTTNKTSEAIYYVAAGPKAHFGKVSIEGLDKVKEAFVLRKLGWKEGECYKPAKTDKAQLTLLETSLFSKSDIIVAEQPDAEGKVDVRLVMHERAQRTIKAGIGFASEEGFDFKPSWEHRNFFGEGEKVTIGGTISTFLNEIQGTYEEPAFLRNDQTLILKSNLTQADTDAYESNKIGASATVERQLNPKLKAGVGIGYSISQVDDGTSKEVYSLVSFPTYIEHNTRDNPLDPTRGHVLRLDVEPLVETLNNGNIFLKSQGTAKFYYQHRKWPGKPIWALRATAGSISGSGTGSIPADERFFSGGGGSVRGYGYQLLGPLSPVTLEPEGGRSLAEFSGELRVRVTENVGIVPFMDAGNVYNQVYPEFGDMYYAAGLGLRYYTSFGPLRLDVAVPLDKRSGIDDGYQFYLSFGQSF